MHYQKAIYQLNSNEIKIVFDENTELISFQFSKYYKAITSTNIHLFLISFFFKYMTYNDVNIFFYIQFNTLLPP